MNIELPNWLDRFRRKKQEEDEIPNPTPAEIPAEEPTKVDDFLGKVKWLGDNYSSAKEVMKLAGAKLTKKELRYSDAVPKSWPTIIVRVKVQSIDCIFYERDGKIVGGKFEWGKPGSVNRGITNLVEGYHGHSVPEKGAKVWAMRVSIDGEMRSNIVEVERD